MDFDFALYYYKEFASTMADCTRQLQVLRARPRAKTPRMRERRQMDIDALEAGLRQAQEKINAITAEWAEKNSRLRLGQRWRSPFNGEIYAINDLAIVPVETARGEELFASAQLCLERDSQRLVFVSDAAMQDWELLNE